MNPFLRKRQSRVNLDKVPKLLQLKEGHSRWYSLIHVPDHMIARFLLKFTIDPRSIRANVQRPGPTNPAPVESIAEEPTKPKSHAELVQEWCAEHLKAQVTLEQAAAIGAREQNVLVKARAGSGKTATIVNRALYLRKAQEVSENSILVLAFNKRAAEEIAKRLSEQGEGRHVYAMTFHALAYRLVQPMQGLLTSDAKTGDMQAKAIHDIIQELMATEGFLERVRSLMLAYFRGETLEVDHLVQVKSVEELKNWRDSVAFETLDGRYVKSFGELRIANFLFEHGIKYQYEKAFEWNGRPYRPDFCIPLAEGKQIIIEYFGMKGDQNYDENSERKRKFWGEDRATAFLEYGPQIVASGKIENQLSIDLMNAGLSLVRKSDIDIWIGIESKATRIFDQLMAQFVGRCRKLGVNVRELRAKIGAHDPLTEAEEEFLDLGFDIYTSYLDFLSHSHKIDFDGLLIAAAAMIQNGKTDFASNRIHGDITNLTHIFIDEFQDFTELNYQLVSAIRSVNPQVSLFCVGDDWQSINGFAGANPRFIEGFHNLFSPAATYELTENFRSTSTIVETGNSLMAGRGTPSRARSTETSNAFLCFPSDLTMTKLEARRFRGDATIASTVRLAAHSFAQGSSVAFLSRRNKLPGRVKVPGNDEDVPETELEEVSRYVKFLFSGKLHPEFQSLTAHRSKGLEADSVIVLDATKRSYPLIHGTWILFRLFGETIETITDEERRLFYVAITRAKSEVYIFSEPYQLSPFIEDILKAVQINSIDWELYRPPAQVLVRISKIPGCNENGTIEIKDYLKSLGYKWDWNEFVWEKYYEATDFNIDQLVASDWSRQARYIQITVETEVPDNIDTYHIYDRAVWEKTDSTAKGNNCDDSAIPEVATPR